MKEMITARLIIGAIRPCDRDATVAILRNDTVKKTYMLPDFDSDEAAYPLFERLMELSLRADRYVFGVRLNDRLIGFLNDVEQTNGTVEMGYAYHPDFYGQGYATEAFAAVIDRLFALGFTTVTAGAFEENPASMRVMEKCGMKRLDREELIDYRGRSHRCICYGIEKP